MFPRISLGQIVLAGIIYFGIPCGIIGCLVGGCKYQVKIEKVK